MKTVINCDIRDIFIYKPPRRTQTDHGKTLRTIIITGLLISGLKPNFNFIDHLTLSVFSDLKGFIVAVCMDRDAVTDTAWKFGFLLVKPRLNIQRNLLYSVSF